MKSVIVWLLLGLAWTPALGSQDGADWLMKINDAASQLNYSGTFVYIQGQRIETMRVTHRAGENDMRQRIYALNGAPREIVRDAKQVWCYVPDKKLGVHEYRQVSKQGFPNLLPRGLEHVVKYYNVYKGSKGRIADREVQQIVITPKDEFRYGYNLWADEHSGLLLKAVLLDQEKRPIEQYLFTHVEIGGEISAQDLEPVTPKGELVWYGDARTENQSKPDGGDMPTGNWVVEKVPEGFMLTRKIKRLSPMRAKMVEHYVYSDGLATVSVFVEQVEGESSVKIDGVSKMGAVHAFGREIDEHQITVVGEVPSQTVDLIGMSVRRKL
ncbi:MAG: Sigma factor AlgU regulatory protein MucB [Gammaproteobacteria bacterium]|nr:Sigma factor AlgU regulatory protein MucB [Gammaproteobacteria bacterium]